ncbi:MAG: hypothetical protein HLUCCO03_17360 [Marinobacter sp. HL-58]|nr:MAG: hypothetical protein HLUCCO03_17360 [Marinobacter sp. HL-58]
MQDYELYYWACPFAVILFNFLWRRFGRITASWMPARSTLIKPEHPVPSENNRNGPGVLYETRPTPRQFSFQP